VKHHASYLEWLISMCADIGVVLHNEEANTLLNYLDRLIETNKLLNLTRITERESAIRLHLVDSLAAIPEVLKAPVGGICDIGTGGGIPGVPIAVVSGRSASVLDSVGKKARAVQTILDSVGLDGAVTAYANRAEQHSRDHRFAYSVVTARAVAPLPSLVELSAPLLAQNGLLVALKGSPSADELRSGEAVAAQVGMKLVSVRALQLPEGGESRTIVTYRRVGASRIKLPRREGIAQHSPLG
jgi:16S rRNA (guanine527-N7)-methyltransferase